MKVGRNEPCPCGSGKKAKYCCAARAAGVTDRDDARFLADLSKRELKELNQRCEDCQMEVWLDVLDLPDWEEACRLIVPALVLLLWRLCGRLWMGVIPMRWQTSCPTH